jgi:hypothetical protein
MTLHPETEKKLDGSGLAFEIGILEYLNERKPRDFETLSLLAELYTRAGRLAAGLKVDCALVAMAPNNPIVHYNLACSHSLMKNIEESLDALELSIRLGYDDAKHLDSDPDLGNVKHTDRFRSLLARITTN